MILGLMIYECKCGREFTSWFAYLNHAKNCNQNTKEYRNGK